MQAKTLGDFFKNLGKCSVKVGKKLAKIVLRNPGQALEIGANVGSAVASRNPLTTLSTLPEGINIYHTGLRFEICLIYAI